jgi:hypothetical protein
MNKHNFVAILRQMTQVVQTAKTLTLTATPFYFELV